MQPHQERVVVELQELSEKRERLDKFIGSQVYYNLPGDERERLCRQHKAMYDYEKVLQERIAHFPPDAPAK